MEAARGSWADVEDQSYIQDKNGKTWRVDRSTDRRVRLIDRAGKQVDIVRPPGGREVTFLHPTDGEVRFTLAKALGARVLASRDAHGTYNCPPPETWDLPAAVWHMERFHRVEPGEMTLDEIRALHLTSQATCPHEHTEVP